MNKTQEALKMAIEAMLKEPQSMEDFEFKEKAINACKEALKPHPDCDEACMFQCQMERKFSQEQEPVAYPSNLFEQIYEEICIWDKAGKHSKGALARRIEALYTHPAQPLSENVVGELIEDYHFGTMTIGDFVRHVEKAHGIGE